MDCRIVIVEIRLVRVEAMEVVLLAHLIPGPSGIFDVGEDDADFGIPVRIVSPHVVIAVRARRIAAGRLEPFVLGRGVIESEVRH